MGEVAPRLRLVRAKPSFEDMYREQYDRVYTYAYSLLMNKESAEDVVQETFVRAYRNYDRYDPAKSSVGTWLCRIAHNRALDLMRSAAHRRSVAWPEEFDPGAPDAQLGQPLEERETVLYLYSKLSPEERELLAMRYTLEMKDREVAATLGLSEKAVNKRYQRLLKKCLSILSQNDEPDRI